MQKFPFLLIIVLSLCLLAGSIAKAQNTGSWVAYFGNQPVGKKITFWNEVQYRDYGIKGDFNQLLLRTGVGINLTENNNNLLIGYAYIITDKTQNKVQELVYENRLWQQFFNKNTINRVILQHRYRAEQRFIDDNINFRFRYMMNIIVPINNKTLAKNTFYTHFFDEVFLNVDSPRFDRNRAYSGLGYVFNHTKRMELGYLAQTLEFSNRNQFQIYFFNTFKLL